MPSVDHTSSPHIQAVAVQCHTGTCDGKYKYGEMRRRLCALSAATAQALHKQGWSSYLQTGLSLPHADRGCPGPNKTLFWTFYMQTAQHQPLECCLLSMGDD